jgi:hypothetical protein
VVQGGGGGIAASSHKIKTINLGGNIMLGACYLTDTTSFYFTDNLMIM